MERFAELEMLSHPVAAGICLLLGSRRGNWQGLALLGFLLGWASLPVAWILTRESRPAAKGGQGFNAAELLRIIRTGTSGAVIT